MGPKEVSIDTVGLPSSEWRAEYQLDLSSFQRVRALERYWASCTAVRISGGNFNCQSFPKFLFQLKAKS